MKINYQLNLNDVSLNDLSNFCVGWKYPLSGEKLYEILENSYRFVIAKSDDKVVGFVNSISDKVHFAFIPMLEVLPEYKNNGIGTELLRILFEQLKDITNIDLTCDVDLQSYYEKFGMLKSHGMVFRKYLNQEVE